MTLPSQFQIAFLITAYVVGIVGLGFADRWILDAVGPHPVIANVTFYTLLAVEGLGGFIAFVLLLSRVEFLWPGYQVGLRNGRAFYEERDATGERCLVFDWFPLTEGYRTRGVARLSPSDTWDHDAPAWARGRRDEIADRIAKELISYDGWPALLLTDAPAIDSTTDSDAASALIWAVLERWPEWAPHVIPVTDPRRGDCVLLSVPPPEHPSHRLEVVCRGEGFEIAYDCAQPGLRAVATLPLADRAAVLFCVCEFLREFREGEMVVLVRRLDLPTQWRRRDGIRYSAAFHSVSLSVRYSQRSRGARDWPFSERQRLGVFGMSVYAWHTGQSQNAS